MQSLTSASSSRSGLSCDAPHAPRHGHRGACPNTFLFKDTCEFICDDGYEFPTPSVSTILCDLATENGIEVLKWHKQPTDCEGKTRRSRFDRVSLTLAYFVVGRGKSILRMHDSDQLYGIYQHQASRDFYLHELSRC